MNKNRELFEVRIDDLEEGIDMISLVDRPAIMVNWKAFSEKQMSDMKFRVADEDKMLLAGPIMIPNLRIYRVTEDGKEIDVYFSKEVIEEAVKRFMRSSRNLNLNENHTVKTVPGFINEIWITDGKHDKSMSMGFSLPEGTAFSIMQITDKQYWKDYVRTGKVRGFSIEGSMTYEKPKDNMKKETKKYAEATTADGVKIYTKTDSAEMVVGDEVFYLDADGVEQVVPDGSAVLSDGSTVVVSAGKITEYTKAVAAEAETPDGNEEFAKIRKEFADGLADILTRLSAVETKLADSEKMNSDLKTELAETKKMAASAPGAKKSIIFNTASKNAPEKKSVSDVKLSLQEKGRILRELANS